MISRLAVACLLVLIAIPLGQAAEPQPNPLRLLFLGDNGHHRPYDRYQLIRPILARRRVELIYSDHIEDLHVDILRNFDGLILYANIDEIDPGRAKVLLDYVSMGGGFIPLHCASYCFRNNDELVALIGAQFQSHGAGVFRVSPDAEQAEHPLIRGYRGLRSWDETYLHTKHNHVNRVVLEHREDPQTGHREPWTWVRTHGAGRVFYTAWGHDERTWSQPGFQNLLERGIRWACHDDPSQVPAHINEPVIVDNLSENPPFQYVTANVPFYPAGKSWGTIEPGERKMQLPLSAEESLQQMVVPEGFHPELVMAEPQFSGKPIAMTWDARGRMWLCETSDYPNELTHNEAGKDRIRVCEDRDADGKIDHSTIFAEGLSIPTSLTFYDGGIVVQSGKETLYLKDTDGDDRADMRHILVTGWDMSDTHGGVSNFQYGLDGWYYGMQGYNDSHPVLVNDQDGQVCTPFRMGFFRFKLAGHGTSVRVTELEFLRSTNNNTWGLGISEEGLIFGSTANGNPSEFMAIPNRFYERVRGWSPSVLNGIADDYFFTPLTSAKVRQVDWHGGFTAGAGHAIYTARRYPPDYWNRTAFVAEPTGHLVATFRLRQDGSQFRSQNAWNLLASRDEWCAPIMAEVGPDGNVWVLDWYNYIVQHNPTPEGFTTGKGNAYESDLRDKKHGRIYRIAYGNHDSPVSYPNLEQATEGERIAVLRHDNFFWRKQAQRLLLEQPGISPEGQQQLVKYLQDPKVDELGLNPGAQHAVWVLSRGTAASDIVKTDSSVSRQGIDPPRSALVESHHWQMMLKHPSPAVRRNAIQALPRDNSCVRALRETGVLRDKDDQVRLAAFLAVADSAESELAAAEILRAWEETRESDRWMRDALTAAAAKNALSFIRAALAHPAEPRRMDLAPILLICSRHFAGDLSEANSIEVTQALAKAASQARRDATFDTVLDGLLSGSRMKGAFDSADLTGDLGLSVLRKLDSLESQARWVAWIRQLGITTEDSAVKDLSEKLIHDRIHNRKLPVSERLVAVECFLRLISDPSEPLTKVCQSVDAQELPEFSLGLIDRLAALDLPAVPQTVLRMGSEGTPSIQSAAIRSLLRRPDWTRSLLDAITSGLYSLQDLSLEQRQQLAHHPDAAIRAIAQELLAAGGGLPDPDRQKILDEMAPMLVSAGDPHSGQRVFEKTCAKCHRIGGTGPTIGPDLAGMRVHPKTELAIHILDPNRSVEGNFRIFMARLDDGRVLSGMLAAETQTSVELVDVEAVRHILPRDQLEELVPSKISLMPEGFEQQHTAAELNDLLEFLIQPEAQNR